MSVIIDATMSEVESVIKYARYGANNCMIGNGWEIKELVRCKDCKFSIPINDDEDGYRCTFHEQYYDNEKRMLWHSGCFCSFAERRSE